MRTQKSPLEAGFGKRLAMQFLEAQAGVEPT